MTPATTYDRNPPSSEPSSSQELLSIARELMATVCNTMITAYGNMVDNSLPLLCYFSPGMQQIPEQRGKPVGAVPRTVTVPCQGSPGNRRGHWASNTQLDYVASYTFTLSQDKEQKKTGDEDPDPVGSVDFWPVGSYL